MHIEKIDFVEFYAPAFPSHAEAATFATRVESLSGLVPAKLALHQGARMLWLADRVEDVAAGRDAFQILFYLIAAEAIAKIVFGEKREGKSRLYVERFLGEICSDKHRAALAHSLKLVPDYFLTWKEAVNILYDVRCDVVHEGQYFTFQLKSEDEHRKFPQFADLNDLHLVAHMSARGLKQIVLEGIVEGVRRVL